MFRLHNMFMNLHGLISLIGEYTQCDKPYIMLNDNGGTFKALYGFKSLVIKFLDYRGPRPSPYNNNGTLKNILFSLEFSFGDPEEELIFKLMFSEHFQEERSDYEVNFSEKTIDLEKTFAYK